MKKWLAIIFGAVDIILLGVIIVSAASGWRISGGIKSSGGDTAGTVRSSVTEAQTENKTAETQKATEKQTQTEAAKPTEKPTAKATEKPTQAPTAAPEKLPYADSLGEPKETDFTWVLDAANGNIPSDAKTLGKDDFIGKWKAEFLYDGIWEMVYVTIARDGTITVEPYWINYGSGWEYEANEAPYTFDGKFADHGVSGSGKYGKISLDTFYESHGVQYGLGTLTPNSGVKATVGLIRP